jgi:hypothetical protein
MDATSRVGRDGAVPQPSARNWRCVCGWRGGDVAPDEAAAQSAPISGGDPALAESLRKQVSEISRLERSAVSDDRALAIGLPRFSYGGGQGLAEAFGCALIRESDESEHWWAMPALDRPEAARTLKIRKDWMEVGFPKKALEAIRFARSATRERWPIHQLATGGIVDIASFVLGYQPLLEAFYTHPKDVHLLLRIVTDVLAEYIAACRQAAGALLPDHVPTMTSGYTICSEVRAVLSVEHFAEFEERYLEDLSGAAGPLCIHSCGDWSRHVPSMARNGTFLGADFGLPEMNWPPAAQLIGDAFWIHPHPSTNTQVVFSNWAEFFYHFARHMRPENRVVISLGADCVADYNAVCDRLATEGDLPPQLASIGRIELPAWAKPAAKEQEAMT